MFCSFVPGIPCATPAAQVTNTALRGHVISPEQLQPPAAFASVAGATSLASAAVGLAAVVGLAVGALRGSGSRRRHRRPQQRGVVSCAAVGGNGTAVAETLLEETILPDVDRSTTKALRKDLTKSDQYFRFNKSQLKEARTTLLENSGSDLLRRVRENGFQLTIGDVTIVLAESYGFCWGVERTLAMAYEARRFFPDKNIWVTNEIIHNATVNQDLADVGMKFVPKALDGGKDFSGIQEGDVCILPAFGASIDEMSFLADRNVKIVDTTCPWVSKVWNAVEKGKGRHYTTIIHGKCGHEETVATKSFADNYLIIRNLAEAEYVSDYMLGKVSTEDFMQKFAGATSEGFDPEKDLDKVGVVNQTTMLKGETELISRLFERVMIRKFGPEDVTEHFMSSNTICDATQLRQDAMYDMFGFKYEAPVSKLYEDLEKEQGGFKLKSDKRVAATSSKALEAATRGGATVETRAALAPKDVDLVLVIGGFNSSNTTHLIEIPQELGVPTYHIDAADRIGDNNGITHKPLKTSPQEAMLEQGLETTQDFLPDGPIVVGVTAGASTPDRLVGACLERILALKKQTA